MALRVAGRISNAEFLAKRESWARDSVSMYAPHLANLAWLNFYAATSVTQADALAALEALPRYSPLPRFDGDAYYERVMGQVLLLAGRVDDAIPYLRHAVNTCFGVYTILSHQVAAEMLGEALEQEGDKAGACDAYAEVLKHWGHAKPLSVTADKARTRGRAIGCGAR